MKEYWVYAVWAAISIVVILIWIIISCIRAARRNIVKKTSTMLQKLLEINSLYNFDSNIRMKYIFEVALQTKPKFDRYDLINLLDENILNNSEFIQNTKAVEYNRNLYSEYFEKINCLQSEMTIEQIKSLHISYKSYIKIEQKLFQIKKLKPILECEITCIALYNSPKGRNHYSKKAEYRMDDVFRRNDILQKQMEYKNSEEARKKRARALMTDKMRYTILKRDGFRCQICGRTADDGVKLHVDHIIPVSKGGATVPENLRTLCETCNWGKSDEIE